MGESLITELDCRSWWLGRHWLIAVVKHVRMLLFFEKLIASICLSECLSSLYPSLIFNTLIDSLSFTVRSPRDWVGLTTFDAESISNQVVSDCVKLRFIDLACGHDGLHQNPANVLGTFLNNGVQAPLELFFFLLAQIEACHARLQVGELRLFIGRLYGKA